MKYKVGDKVRIRSKEWYDSHKNKFGKIWIDCLSREGTICFDQDNAKYCGKEVTIFSVEPDNYVLRGIPYEWTDEMIEGLAEDETKPKYEDEVNGEYYSTPKYLVRPSGYQFVDENGNIINATKIVLEKKKKEYPKTYAECCMALGIPIHGGIALVGNWCMEDGYIAQHLETLRALSKLLIYRDAYWKIAGEEMGLGEPWKPDWKSLNPQYIILYQYGDIDKAETHGEGNYILAFPTEEMRDAFYENFKEEIEQCKELL